MKNEKFRVSFAHTHYNRVRAGTETGPYVGVQNGVYSRRDEHCSSAFCPSSVSLVGHDAHIVPFYPSSVCLTAATFCSAADGSPLCLLRRHFPCQGEFPEGKA